MTRLDDLRRRLSRLKNRRQWFRLETGYSALGTAVLVALAVAFPIDWYFQQNMDVWQRLFLLAVCGAAVVWAFIRYTRPWLGRHESDLEVAILVERHEHIDSDLVAALQFESPEAPQWGSVALEQAVIDQVAVKGKRLRVMENLPRQERRRRLVVLAAAVGVWAIVALAVPRHVGVFLNHLLLGSRHYPTRTQLDLLAINGTAVDPAAPGRSHLRMRYGQTVRFEAQCSGVPPAAGRVELVAPHSGLRATVPLELVGEKPAEDEPNVYKGELPRLVENVRYQVYLGDAWTDAAELAATQLPAIELEADVIPPSYISGKQTISRGMRMFSVVEGSQVRMKVRSDRALKGAVLTLEDKPYALGREGMTPGGAEIWTLGQQETPLGAVVEPVRYSLQVLDTEDQQLERPIEGVVRIQPDTPPRVAAATVTHTIRAVAAPTIGVRVIDDHAVGRMWFTVEIVHHEGATDTRSEQREGETEIYKYDPATAPRRDVELIHKLSMEPFRLSKGDTVKVTVHASDYRGPRPGKATASEPVVFQVTDEQGVLSSVLQTDKETARELKTMIQRQLGIGEQ